MINNEMNKSNAPELNRNVPMKKNPDEFGGIYFSSVVKIYDPETEEVLVHKRGDD